MAGSGRSHLRDQDDVILQVNNLTVEYTVSADKRVQAVSDISFDVAPGETLGIVGESGSGKSTTVKALLRLVDATAGRVLFNGDEISKLTPTEFHAVRPKIQMVFQDPSSSLNPYRRISDIVSEPFIVSGEDDNLVVKVGELFDAVGLDPDWADRYPHQMSGGQCQRVSIARSIALHPDILVCDEPVSSLDVSVQAQILNLLESLKDEFGLTLLFISHDLAVVKNVSDKVLVMYMGKLCEYATPDALYEQPAHPYTDAMIRSIPVPDPSAPAITTELDGEPPSALEASQGCRFATRCPYAQDRCRTDEPTMRQIADGHYVACHYPLHGGEAPQPVRVEVNGQQGA